MQNFTGCQSEGETEIERLVHVEPSAGLIKIHSLKTYGT